MQAVQAPSAKWTLADGSNFISEQHPDLAAVIPANPEPALSYSLGTQGVAITGATDLLTKFRPGTCRKTQSCVYNGLLWYIASDGQTLVSLNMATSTLTVEDTITDIFVAVATDGANSMVVLELTAAGLGLFIKTEN